MWIESELFEIKVPIFFLGMVGFSLRRDGRYASFLKSSVLFGQEFMHYDWLMPGFSCCWRARRRCW
jgi:hypothetical protein